MMSSYVKNTPRHLLNARSDAVRHPTVQQRPTVPQTHAPRVVQTKTQAAPFARTPPAAPPVYRPQPVPKVLQTKKASGAHAAMQPAHLIHRPRPHSTPVQPKMVAARLSPAAPSVPQVGVRPRVVQQSVARHSRASVVQAIKLYPNLHPGAVERVEPSSVFRLENFTDQYRLRKTDSHGVYVPNQQYNFVRTGDGAMLLHNRYRHPSIAEGRQVLYAGEAFFNNGKLEWWSNGSGHYQPDADDAAQAALPLSNFYTYQQIIKGEHKRRQPAAR
jgi:hypothetical protein